MPILTLSYLAESCLILPCHILPSLAKSYLIISRKILPNLTLSYLAKSCQILLFRGCRRQPLYCFQIDVFIWLHVTDIYIYNTPTYGCTSMLTFILNVLSEVLGIGNLYCRPFYSAGSGPCARPRDFENRLLSDVLANFGRFLPPLILEQTLTALLADGQRHSFETAPNRSWTSPAPSSIMAAPASEDFTLPPGTHDRSNVETGERRDMLTLTFFNHF